MNTLTCIYTHICPQLQVDEKLYFELEMVQKQVYTPECMHAYKIGQSLALLCALIENTLS